MALQSRLYSLVARRLGGSLVGTTEPPTNIPRKFALYSVVKLPGAPTWVLNDHCGQVDRLSTVSPSRRQHKMVLLKEEYLPKSKS